MKVLWITDGVNWGFDTRAKAVSERLSMYKHIIIPRPTLSFSSVFDKIKDCNPDIIMAMSPSILRYLRNYADRLIATLPSFSAVGIKQYE